MQAVTRICPYPRHCETMRVTRCIIAVLSGPGEATARGAAAMCGIALILPAPAMAQAAPGPRFDIAGQGLAAALDQLARQAGVQILYPYQIAAARRTGGVRGQMPLRTALDRLLRGTGLEVARATERVVTLRPAPVAAPSLRPAVRRPVPMPATPAPSSAPDAPLPDIVVTGRANEAPLAQTELSYALTELDGPTLARKSPLSTADLFKLISGFLGRIDRRGSEQQCPLARHSDRRLFLGRAARGRPAGAI